MDNRNTPSTIKKARFKFDMPDPFILGFTAIMTIFGLVMIFNASSFRAHENGDSQFHFLILQSVWIVISLIPATLIYFWDYRKFAKLATPSFIIVFIALIAVLFFGNSINGAKRWIEILGFPLQPTEFLKPVIVLFLASWLSKDDNSTNALAKAHTLKDVLKTRFGINMIRFLIILGITLVLIILEPDMGTTMIVGITSVIILFLTGRDSIQRFWTTAMLGLFGVLGIFAAILERYRLSRILTFFDLLKTGEVSNPTKDGYQMSQILMGIGSGGFLGVGFGQSRQRFGYLVENTAFTDSIFAVILEELGMLGGIVIILSWLVFFWRGINIALSSKDKLGEVLAAGITIWLTLQALINMAATVGLMPLTGIPLPLLSYGGSSTLVTFIGIAILLNIARINKIENNEHRK